MTTILNNDIATPLYMLVHVYVKINDTKNDYFFRLEYLHHPIFRKF